MSGLTDFSTLCVQAKTLGIKGTRLKYAGLKDSKAKTTQRISAYRLTPAELATGLSKANPRWYDGEFIKANETETTSAHDHNRTSESAGGSDAQYMRVRIGNVELVPQGQFVGNLAGNRFTLRLRDVHDQRNTADANQVEHCLNAWQQRGFINYFGLQRFGTNAAAPTHFVGRALLQKQFKSALRLVMLSSHASAASEAGVSARSGRSRRFAPHVVAVEAALRNLHPTWWEEFQAAGVVDNIPDTVCRDVLHHLPSQMTRLYLHSYQSYVWNRIASQLVSELEASVDEVLVELARTVLISPGQNAAEVGDRKTVQDIESVLAEDGLGISDFVTPVMGHALPCQSRQVVVHPEEVQFRWLSADPEVAVPDESTSTQKFPHLELQFSLPSGAYATCALRELSRRPIVWD